LRSSALGLKQFEASRFDEKIERDARTGRLDRFAEEALADYRKDQVARRL
jgi:hypothetical protein